MRVWCVHLSSVASSCSKEALLTLYCSSPLLTCVLCTRALLFIPLFLPPCLHALTVADLAHKIAMFLMEDTGSIRPWATWDAFITEASPSVMNVRVRPSLGNPGATTSTALDLLRNHMHDMARYQIQHTSSVDYRRGHMLPAQAKHQGNRIIIDPIQFQTRKTSNIDRPVWIAGLSVLVSAVSRGGVRSLESYGVRSYVVSQPFMGSMIIVRPGIRELPRYRAPASPLAEEGEEIRSSECILMR